MKIESKFDIGDIAYFIYSFYDEKDLDLKNISSYILKDIITGFLYKQNNSTDFNPTLFCGFGDGGMDSDFSELEEESKCFISKEELVEYYKSKQEFGNL